MSVCKVALNLAIEEEPLVSSVNEHEFQNGENIFDELSPPNVKHMQREIIDAMNNVL